MIRAIGQNDVLEAILLMNKSNNFNENLQLYSPKMFKIMEYINRFIKSDTTNG